MVGDNVAGHRTVLPCWRSECEMIDPMRYFIVALVLSVFIVAFWRVVLLAVVVALLALVLLGGLAVAQAASFLGR
jgi:asparagine N-glycosylation enzyme membrane subunit Stt3